MPHKPLTDNPTHIELLGVGRRSLTELLHEHACLALQRQHLGHALLLALGLQEVAETALHKRPAQQ